MIDSPEDIPAEKPSQFLDEVLRPISDENPVGEDITYGEAFQSIKAEIGKLETLSVEDRDGANMSLVVSKSRRVLAKQSKDLRVACYLAIGCAKQSVGGDLKRIDTQLLSDGLDAVQAISGKYWESMYPPLKRVAIRANALDYLLELVRSVFEMIKVNESDRAGLEGCIVHLGQLNDTCNGAIDAGEVRETIAAAQKALNRISRPVAPPAAPKPPLPMDAGVRVPEDTAAPTDTRTPASAPPASASSSSGGAVEIKGKGDAQSLLFKAAAYLRSANPSDPAPYSIVRAIRWDSMSAVPPHTEQKTALPEPRDQVLAGIVASMDRSDSKGALENAESLFRESPMHFHFGLQRMAVSAAEEMGGPFEDVAAVIRGSLQRLFHRLPELMDLQFKGGTPFVDSQTAEWLNADVLGQSVGAPAVTPIVAGGENTGEHTEVFEEAQKLVKRKKLAEAIGLLQNHLRGVRSERDRFVVEHKMAALCIAAKRPDVARPILDRLTAVSDRFSLDEWDPDQTLPMLKDMLSCYETLSKKDKALAERAEDVFDRICRIDPTFALLNKR